MTVQALGQFYLPQLAIPYQSMVAPRVEVLLRNNPHEAGGLLSVTSYVTRTIQLDALVGAVAPNLNVAIETMVQGDTRPIARPGDWLEINSFDLVRRLNPAFNHSESDTPKADRVLMQPLEDATGQVFGRAFISPSRYSLSADVGCVTISGLRAARLHNVQGVLLGEAVTAARDAARPLVTKEALERWASKQAEMIGASVKDEERQARSAEVVLECGGEIGYLKFVKWGSDWLTPSEFEEQLRSSTEIAISFDGEFDYDEDQDDVHPREFREDFTISERIALVLKHDGGILEIGNNSWPRSVTGQPKRNVSNAAAYIGDLIRRVWGENIHEDEEERVVGKVGGFDITRQLIVFRVANEEKPF